MNEVRKEAGKPVSGSVLLYKLSKADVSGLVIDTHLRESRSSSC